MDCPGGLLINWINEYAILTIQFKSFKPESYVLADESTMNTISHYG